MPRKPNGRGPGWRKGQKGKLTTEPTKQLDLEEKAMIFKLSEAGKSINQIAEAIGRHPSSVSRFLAKYRDTTSEAKLIIRAGAAKLANRVIKAADVNQAMDLLSRPGIDVITPPVAAKAAGTNGFSVSVGVSSLGAVAQVKSGANHGPKLPGVQERNLLDAGAPADGQQDITINVEAAVESAQRSDEVGNLGGAQEGAVAPTSAVEVIDHA